MFWATFNCQPSLSARVLLVRKYRGMATDGGSLIALTSLRESSWIKLQCYSFSEIFDLGKLLWMATTMLNQRPVAGQGLRGAQLGWEQGSLRCFCSCRKSVTWVCLSNTALPWGWGEECWSNLIWKTRFMRVFCKAPTKSQSASGSDLEWDIVLIQHLKVVVALFNSLSDKSKTLSAAIQILTCLFMLLPSLVPLPSLLRLSFLWKIHPFQKEETSTTKPLHPARCLWSGWSLRLLCWPRLMINTYLSFHRAGS